MAESDKMTKFTEKFGYKAIFAGVYTDKSIETMKREIDTFFDEGIPYVYLENIGSLKNAVEFVPETSKIIQILQHYDKENLTSRIGVNILPNMTGTEHAIAYSLAKAYNLPFIMDDMISGRYRKRLTESEPGTLQESELDARSFYTCRKENPDITVIGGIMPGYAEYIDNGIAPLFHSIYDPQKPGVKDNPLMISISKDRADALMVKTYAGETEVPLERVFMYKNITGLPIILASRVNARNIKLYAEPADAYIIGAAFRKEGKTSGKILLENIEEVKQNLKYALKDPSITNFSNA